MSDSSVSPIPTTTTTPFDRRAHQYDTRFSNRLPAKWLRDATRHRIEPLIRTGDTVLEIGCGTGVDALWLANRGCYVIATDASDAMLAIARGKVVSPESAARLTWARLDAGQPAQLADLLGPARRAHLVLSNFGALNCVRDLAPLFAVIRLLLDPNGHVVVTLMGRFCLWETLQYGARGRWTHMRRRWSGVSRYGDSESSIDVWYHSPADVLRMASGFERAGLYGIGALIPPSEAFGICERWPRLFGRLARVDQQLGPWLHGLSDHYLMVLRLRQ